MAKPIKMDKLKGGIPELVAGLSADGSEAAATKAIITNDLVTKSIALETVLHDRPVRMGASRRGRA